MLDGVHSCMLTWGEPPQPVHHIAVLLWGKGGGAGGLEPPLAGTEQHSPSLARGSKWQTSTACDMARGVKGSGQGRDPSCSKSSLGLSSLSSNAALGTELHHHSEILWYVNIISVIHALIKNNSYFKCCILHFSKYADSLCLSDRPCWSYRTPGSLSLASANILPLSQSLCAG